MKNQKPKTKNKKYPVFSSPVVMRSIYYGRRDLLNPIEQLETSPHRLYGDSSRIQLIHMQETPTTSSPESDLARGLAEFRQGRKSLLPEFELPTDDIPKEEQPEVSIERLTAYNFEQILKGLNVEERLKDPIFLKQLTIDFNNDLELGKIDPINASWACLTLSAIRSLGINLPGLNPEELITKINNDSSLLEQLTENINYRLKQGNTIPAYSALVCKTLAAIRTLDINLPVLNPEKLITKINNDPNFLEQLTKELNDHLERGKTRPAYASSACWALSTIKNFNNHYYAVADEKEAAQAAERLQTAADRTGVPKRPEQKAF